MAKIKRREFLKKSAGTAVLMGSPWILANCISKNPAPGLSLQKKAQVLSVKGDDLYSMTRDVLDALGGMKTIVNEGETVFIKPNFVTFPWAKTNNCFHKGECTKPEIIIAVAEECLKAGASEVIVGEGSHLPEFDWQYAVTLDGKTNLVQEANRLNSLYSGKVTLACLETATRKWVEVPSKTSSGRIAVSGLAATADRVISIPVAKTHSWAQLTLAAKNFIGITPLSRYAQFINGTYWNRGSFNHSSPKSIAQVYLDIVKGIKPDLSIIDFSIGLEGNGPTLDNGASTVDMKKRLGSWALIASKDIMAADATAARIMNHNPEKIRHLAMGYDMGLGEIHEENIKLLGENLNNLRVDWKPARLMG